MSIKDRWGQKAPDTTEESPALSRYQEDGDLIIQSENHPDSAWIEMPVEHTQEVRL